MNIAQLTLLINGKRSLQFAVVLVLVLLTSARAQADQLRVFEEKVGPIPEFVIHLKAGETILIETRNLSPGIDPVLHLWDLANKVEVAMDDNSGGGNAAKLRKLITRTDNYVLIVRPRNFLSAGTTDIFKNGVLFKRQVQVEGWYVFLLNLQAKEQISVLPPPLGAPTHMMYLISEDGLHIESRRRGSPRSQWEAPAGIFGAQTMLIGVRPQDGGKPMRLYRNDVKLPGADPDGDGLGSGLERQLGTCSVRSDSLGPFFCDSDHVTDMRDSDGDGISDGWEVLGRDFSPTVYVPLPTWGSNPRHKDMFIEADYRRLNQAENQQSPQHMPPAVAIAFARAYGDSNTTDPLLRLIHATTVNNPDQQPGISVHIDTGVKPAKPADAGIYGDWGGYDVIDAVADAKGNIVGQEPAALWKTHMDPSRRGIFRYGPGHATGGAQCKIGVIFCGYNFNDPTSAIHEMMHSLGFDHSGPSGISALGANCKPNYPSAVNYAYMSDMLMSDGQGRPPLNNTALSESGAVPTSNKRYLSDLHSKFQYLVNPAKGDVDWNRDGVFAPAGQRVRAYANFVPNGIGCEFTRLNQVNFRDTAKSVAITRLGAHTLVFSVDTAGRVNLRQSISRWKCPPAEQNCEGSSFDVASTIIPFPVPSQSMDAEVVKINGEEEVSLVALGQDGKMRERRLTFTSIDELRISLEAREIPSAVAVAGEPSLAATRDGLGIYLIYKGVDNLLRWRFRNTGIWPAETIARNLNGDAIVAAGEASPALASAYLPSTPNGTPGLYLAFSDATHALRIFFLNDAKRWQRTTLMSESAPLNTVGRPAMAWVPNTTADDSRGQFYLVFRDANDVYKMMRTYFNDSILPQKGIRIGLLADFDVVDLKGKAIDVTASSSTGDPQLWAVLHFDRPRDDGNVDPFVLFRPRADGIVDITQTNHNDWATLGWGVCQTVVNPENTVPNPIQCPFRPF